MDAEREDIVFGKIAVKKGFISKGQLKECIKRRKELESEDGPAPSLKKILVETGYVSEAQAEEIERIQETVTEKSEIQIPGYEIHEKLGEGATGAVHKATQLSMDRTVAIKILFPSVTDDEEYLERFYREARTVAKLRHRNIIQGIDVGEENGVHYFVMEYVDGPTLDEILREKGIISEERATKIGLQMARALEHAAENGLIHRDVKVDEVAFALNLGGDSVETENGTFQADPYQSKNDTSRRGTATATNEPITADKFKRIYPELETSRPAGRSTGFSNRRKINPTSSEKIISRSSISPDRQNRNPSFSDTADPRSPESDSSDASEDESDSSENVPDEVVLKKLTYRYYEGHWKQFPPFEHLDPIDAGRLENGKISLDPEQRDEFYGFVYMGVLHIPKDGTYRFALKSDDGSRLLINGTQIVNNDGRHIPRTKTNSTRIRAGTYVLRLEFFQSWGESMLELVLQTPDETRVKLTE